MDDELGAEDLRKLNRRTPPWRGLLGWVLALFFLSTAYFVGYYTRDSRPEPTRIVHRYVLPRSCVRSILEASNAMDAVSNLVTAQGIGATGDARDFAAQYQQAHEGFARDLVRCEHEHSIPRPLAGP